MNVAGVTNVDPGEVSMKFLLAAFSSHIDHIKLMQSIAVGILTLLAAVIAIGIRPESRVPASIPFRVAICIQWALCVATVVQAHRSLKRLSTCLSSAGQMFISFGEGSKKATDEFNATAAQVGEAIRRTSIAFTAMALFLVVPGVIMLFFGT